MPEKLANMPEERKLQALLTVAQSCAKRSQEALRSVAVDNANDYAFTYLASCLIRIKSTRYLTWGNLRTELCAPCSVEMLKSIATRRKNPSKELYNRLTLAITGYTQRYRLEVPIFTPYMEK